MDAPPQVNLGDGRVGDAGDVGTQHPIGVLAPGEGGIEVADTLKNLTAHDHRREHKVTGHAVDPFGFDPGGRGLPGFEKVHHPGEAKPDLGVTLEQPDLSIELAGEPEIVAIEEGEQGASTGANRGVAGGGDSTVGEGQEPDSGVSTRHLSCTIGRAVVGDDHLERVVTLREDAVERLAEVVLAVVGRYDHADHVFHRGQLAAVGALPRRFRSMFFLAILTRRADSESIERLRFELWMRRRR